MKYSYSYFSSHFCFLVIVVLLMLMLPVLFLVTVISLFFNVVFKSSYWWIHAIFSTGESSSSFFSSISFLLLLFYFLRVFLHSFSTVLILLKPVRQKVCSGLQDTFKYSYLLFPSSLFQVSGDRSKSTNYNRHLHILQSFQLSSKIQGFFYLFVCFHCQSVDSWTDKIHLMISSFLLVN